MTLPKRITVPGSKSLTNRALLLAALAKGKSVLKNVLLSNDTQVMSEALKALGIPIEQKGTTLEIQGNPDWKAPQKPLHLGNAGTAVRFLTAVLANQPFTSEIEGDQRMKERPLQDLIDALRTLGAVIDCPTGCPPLKIEGARLSKNSTTLRGEISSQYLSALLMLGPRLPNGLTITRKGTLTSRPYVDLTIDLMNKFCTQVIEDVERFYIPRGEYCPQNLTIEPDASSATYFWGLAALTGKRFIVEHLDPKSCQPDMAILKALQKMGCQVEMGKEEIIVQGPSHLKALGPYDANAFPDGAMTLAVLAAFAEGETVLMGLQTLKHKESNRLNALAAELRKIGAHTHATHDTLTIRGLMGDTAKQPLHAPSIATYNDHRMAMSFGIAKARIPQLNIENPNCVSKTYPHFWEDLQTILE